ncbi:MAG TPA: potassium channel protein [Caldithrix sp.]|nr:potassium channel protein [Calditrichaceae bacterium]HEM49315.1 potassium channel protein [Caldithrix sp.]
MLKTDTTLRRNFITVAVFTSILIIIGMIGFILIEGWSPIDALYMTFISFSTVGFKEVAELSLAGRLFTMFIIVLGMMVIAMLSASVTSLFVRNELLSKRKRQKMKKEIAKLEGHTILCGAGDTGTTVIEEFIRAKKQLVVIENNQELVDELEIDYPEVYFLNGDATKDEALHEANIEKAGGLITTLSIDADNLFVVVSAKSINPNMIIISRSVDSHTENKLYKAGASYVISPNIVEGMRMAAVMLRPTVVSFLEVMMRSDEFSYRMEEITIPKGAKITGKTLKDAEIPQKTGLIVIAVKRATDSQMLFNPSSSTIFKENDKIIVLGDPEKTDKLTALLSQ